MQPVTQYVQQAVNVPVTQYRAVTTTKYVQMQPGYAAPVGYPAPPPGVMPTAPVAPAASPFAAPVQTTPQAWGAAGSDVPRQLVPGQPAPVQPFAGAPALPPTGYQQPTYQQPTYQQPTYQQPITPQAGTFAQPPAAAPLQPQPTQPPALAPAPSLKPIPEMPRTNGDARATMPSAAGNGQVPPPSLAPATPPATSGSNGLAPAPTGQAAPPTGGQGMPVLPGAGPTGATRAFPRLLEPTGHTTSWQPAGGQGRPAAYGPRYPAAALPSLLTQ
jgi:hypothetical protein